MNEYSFVRRLPVPYFPQLENLRSLAHKTPHVTFGYHGYLRLGNGR